MDQQIVIIAGPNGAGKTTFAREFLVKEANCPAFVNADLIAAGLAPFTPERPSLCSFDPGMARHRVQSQAHLSKSAGFRNGR